MDHEFQKIHGPWISKNSWTMNFQKSWDIDFQNCLDCDIFFENFFLKILVELCFDLILDYRFWCGWYCWYCRYCRFWLNYWKPLKKSWHLFFLFKVYYSPDNCRERFYSITRNFNNNYNNINIRNKLKYATMKFFGNYKFLYIFIYKYINIYEYI